MNPSLRTDLRALEVFGRRFAERAQRVPLRSTNTKLTHDRLKRVLLLSQPGTVRLAFHDRNRCPRSVWRDQRMWLAEQLHQRWCEENDIDSRDPRAKSVRVLSGLVHRDAGPGKSCGRLVSSREIVEEVRSALQRVDRGELALRRMVTEYERRGYGLSLDRLVPQSTALRSRRGAYVRGAFTRRAWDNGVRDLLRGDENVEF